MSYRAFKRLLGETSLERKCRFLFGAGTLLLITTIFWWFAWRTEVLAYEQTTTTGRLLTNLILKEVHHKEDLNVKDRELLEQVLRKFEDQNLAEESPRYVYSIIKPNAPNRENQPEGSFEHRLLADLQNNKEVVAARQRQPDERYLHELLFDNDEASRRAFGTGLTLELHLQLLAPFAAIVFALIPLVCLLPGDFNRRGQGRRILAAIVCAVLFQIIDLGCKNLASHNMAAVPLLYLDMLLPIAAGAWLLMREGRWPWLPRLPSPASA